MSHPIRTVTIGELCREGGGDVQTGPFGSQLKASAYVPIGIPTIMPANLIDYRVVDEGIARIGPEDHARLSKHHLRPGDIVYGRRGDIGRHALVTDRESGWLCGTGCLRIRFGDAAVHPVYASYYLRQPQVIELILGLAVGTTMPNLNTSILESVPLDLPPLPIQQRIAEILGRLDDKIEANRRINRTLEQMAQALYKHWFVDFGPFQDGEFVESELGLIPKGWGVKRLGDVASITTGKSYRSSELAESTTALVTLKSISRGGGYRPDGLKAFIGAYKPEQVVRPGEVVLAYTDVTQAAEVIGRPAIVRSDEQFQTLVVSLDLGVVRPKTHGMSSGFLYFLLGTSDFRGYSYGHTNGTTVLHLSKQSVPKYQFVCPTREILEDFDRVVASLLEAIELNEIESRQLAVIRDYLLPRLLSGGLAV